AMLVSPGNYPIADLMMRDRPEAARALGLQIQVLNASTGRDIEAAFATMSRDRAEALFVAPDGFFNSRRNWPTSRRAARSLFCAVGAIAGIAQTWDNEPSLIESIVDRRRPKMNIGMNPSHPLHAFLSGNQTDETDVLCSTFFETINGGSGCIPIPPHRHPD